MVNYGRSRACLTCKKRRVKCDMTLPRCQRCIKIGKECPGYSDAWDLAQRNENGLVALKVHGNLGLSPKSSITVLPNDLESWVTQVFFRDYVLEPSGSFDGWLSFMPEMFRQADEGSILHLSVCAAAYANFYQKTKRKDIEILAIAAYNRALNMAGTVLIKCCNKPRETTLMAIFLLGLYENITSVVVESPRQWHSVALGIMTDLRGQLLLEGNGPGLLQTVCCQMQRRNLDFELDPGPADTRLMGLLDTSELPNQALHNYFEVSRFVARTQTDILLGNTTSEWTDDLISQVTALEKRFQAWDKAATGMRHDATTLSIGAKINTYSAWIECFWNKSRACRMLMHQKFLEGLSANQSSDHHETHRVCSLLMIDNLVKAILNSIPGALNFGPPLLTSSSPRSLGGYINIWPLQVAMQCLHAQRAERIQARNSLEQIGLECGLSYAVVYARSYEVVEEL